MTVTPSTILAVSKHVPWNKGKIVGAKPPLRPKHVWSIRTKLQVEGRMRDLARRPRDSRTSRRLISGAGQSRAALPSQTASGRQRKQASFTRSFFGFDYRPNCPPLKCFETARCGFHFAPAPAFHIADRSSPQ